MANQVAHANATPILHVVNGPRIPMAKVGDQYRAQLPLTGERIQYWIESKGRRHLHTSNPLVDYFEGGEVSVTHQSSCDRPALYLTDNPEVDPDEVLTLVLARSQNGGALNASSVRANVGEHALTTQVEGDHIQISLKGIPKGKHHIQVTAQDQSGVTLTRTGPVWVEDTPFQWSDALLYQIMIDRFAGQHDLGPRARAQSPGLRAGGTIQGILRKLKSGYFEELGSNVLWLSPVYTNATGLWVGVEGGAARYSSYHGYWPTQARSIEPLLGNTDDLKALVAAAHERGMRVILDVVPNHVHEDHIYLTSHPEWFDSEPCICGTTECPWWKDIQTCWFTPYMPDVDWTHPDTIPHIVDDLLWWIDTFNLDGLRVDAVPMMPRRFTRHLAHAVREQFESMGTRIYLLGETFTGPDGYDSIRYALGPHGLDGQFDFPLMWALRRTFAWEDDGLDALYQRWQTSQKSWAGSGAVMATMIGNHDVTRFTSEAQGTLGYADPWAQPAPPISRTKVYGKVKRAWSFILTMPGLPIIYAGDEYGEVGGRDPDNRRPMRFNAERTDAEKALHTTVARLGRLRRCLPALRSNVVELIDVNTERLIVKRGEPHEAPAILVFQRHGPFTPLPEPHALIEGPMQDALSGQIYDPQTHQLFPPNDTGFGTQIWIPVGNACVDN